MMPFGLACCTALVLSLHFTPSCPAMRGQLDGAGLAVSCNADDSLTRRVAWVLGATFNPETTMLGTQLDFGGALVEGSTAIRGPVRRATGLKIEPLITREGAPRLRAARWPASGVGQRLGCLLGHVDY
jgi:hypothetical protein